MKQFTLDPAFICSVTTRDSGSIYHGRESLTPEETVSVLKGYGQWSTISIDDHPEFAALRNQLEEEGYIRTFRQWSNGDRVRKSFALNGRVFKKGDQFACAAAQSTSLHLYKNHGPNQHLNLSDNPIGDNLISDLGNI